MPLLANRWQRYKNYKTVKIWYDKMWTAPYIANRMHWETFVPGIHCVLAALRRWFLRCHWASTIQQPILQVSQYKYWIGYLNVCVASNVTCLQLSAVRTSANTWRHSINTANCDFMFTWLTVKCNKSSRMKLTQYSPYDTTSMVGCKCVYHKIHIVKHRLHTLLQSSQPSTFYRMAKLVSDFLPCITPCNNTKWWQADSQPTRVDLAWESAGTWHASMF